MKSDTIPLASWYRNLIVLLPIPIVLLGSIHINYSDVILGIMEGQNLSSNNFFELYTQLTIFQDRKITTDSTGNLPEIVRLIGDASLKALCILFLLWIVCFSISSYIKLSYNMGSKLLMFCELAIMVTLFTLVVIPDMHILISISGYLALTLILLVLLLYWIEGIRSRR